MNLLNFIHQLQALYFKHGDMPVAVAVDQTDTAAWQDVTAIRVDTDDEWTGVVLNFEKQ